MRAGASGAIRPGSSSRKVVFRAPCVVGDQREEVLRLRLVLRLRDAGREVAHAREEPVDQAVGPLEGGALDQSREHPAERVEAAAVDRVEEQPDEGSAFLAEPVEPGLQGEEGQVVEGHERRRLLPEAVGRRRRRAEVGDHPDVPERTAPGVERLLDRLRRDGGQVHRPGRVAGRDREHQRLAEALRHRREQLRPVGQHDGVGRDEVQARPHGLEREALEQRDVAADLHRLTRRVLLDVEVAHGNRACRRCRLAGLLLLDDRGDRHAHRRPEPGVLAGDDRGRRGVERTQHAERPLGAEVVAAVAARAALDDGHVAVGRDGDGPLGHIAEDRQACLGRPLLERQRQDEGALGEVRAVGAELPCEQIAGLHRRVPACAADEGHVQLAAAQVADPDLDRGERGRDARVHRHVQPVEVEVVRDPGRDDVGHHPRERVLVRGGHQAVDLLAQGLEERFQVRRAGQLRVAAERLVDVVQVRARGVERRRPGRAQVAEDHAGAGPVRLPELPELPLELVGALDHHQLTAVDRPDHRRRHAHLVERGHGVELAERAARSGPAAP